MRGGLVLVSGQMGSGKSTTVTSLWLHLAAPPHRVVSIEDPVEFIYPTRHGQSMFTMRELDTSCEGYEQALLEVRRQNATAVSIGEIRGAESAEKCLRFALIGLLVVATIHGENVPSTLSFLRRRIAARAGRMGALEPCDRLPPGRGPAPDPQPETGRSSRSMRRCST